MSSHPLHLLLTIQNVLCLDTNLTSQHKTLSKLHWFPHPLPLYQVRSLGPLHSPPPSHLTSIPGALGTRAIEQGYSIPVRSRICSHPKVALHSSHKVIANSYLLVMIITIVECAQRGIQKKEIDVLFERMALSTAKKLSRLRPRIAEDPVVVDTVKLNLETKLSEASESCNSRPERSNHNRIKALVTLELSPNFYELEEELINIKWGHSQGNVSESDVRCKQPVACMLEQVSILAWVFWDSNVDRFL